MNKMEQALQNETIALLECAEKIAQMNESLEGLMTSMRPDIEAKLTDSSSILSQVLQSLYDSRN
jgi:hypothetical protein